MCSGVDQRFRCSQNETTFQNAQEIATLAGPGNNLTTATGNGTLKGTNVPSISVISYGSEALIQPGSGQACNVSAATCSYAQYYDTCSTLQPWHGYLAGYQCAYLCRALLL